jgi:hypothetical protein
MQERRHGHAVPINLNVNCPSAVGLGGTGTGHWQRLVKRGRMPVPPSGMSAAHRPCAAHRGTGIGRGHGSCFRVRVLVMGLPPGQPDQTAGCRPAPARPGPGGVTVARARNCLRASGRAVRRRVTVTRTELKEKLTTGNELEDPETRAEVNLSRPPGPPRLGLTTLTP